MGFPDVEDFWLTEQPFDVVCHMLRELGETPLSLLFYCTEFLRVSCYSGSRYPPRWELVEKTCWFIRQLHACSWNLTFTESGYPFVVDIPLDSHEPRAGKKGGGTGGSHVGGGHVGDSHVGDSHVGDGHVGGGHVGGYTNEESMG